MVVTDDTCINNKCDRVLYLCLTAFKKAVRVWDSTVDGQTRLASKCRGIDDPYVPSMWTSGGGALSSRRPLRMGVQLRGGWCAYAAFVKEWFPNMGEVDHERGTMGRWVDGGVRYGGEIVAWTHLWKCRELERHQQPRSHWWGWKPPQGRGKISWKQWFFEKHSYSFIANKKNCTMADIIFILAHHFSVYIICI